MPFAARDAGRTLSSSGRRHWLILVAALGLAAPLTSQAQMAEQLFKTAIDKFGGGCKAITRTRPLGSASGSRALVAAECSNQRQHVLMIYPDNTVSYMSTCTTFKARTGESCFERK